MLDHVRNVEELWGHRLSGLSVSVQELRLLESFASFYRTYHNGKHNLRKGHLLDAYANILHALEHWARIVIIEHGEKPETLIWEQVYKINVGVYKLYEELAMNKESLDQRIRLVLLACEFSVMSKMEKCCAALLRIVESRSEPWSLEELQSCPQLASVTDELPLLLKKLIKKSLVRAVIVSVTNHTVSTEQRFAR